MNKPIVTAYYPCRFCIEYTFAFCIATTIFHRAFIIKAFFGNDEYTFAIAKTL